jgi:hypothetical protein
MWGDFMKSIALLVVLLAMATSAHASHIKYTYLMVGAGQSAQVYAFKSKGECEAARRKYDRDWNRMIAQLKKQIGNRGTFAGSGNPRCKSSLPNGFQRPKTGH